VIRAATVLQTQGAPQAMLPHPLCLSPRRVNTRNRREVTKEGAIAANRRDQTSSTNGSIGRLQMPPIPVKSSGCSRSFSKISVR